MDFTKLISYLKPWSHVIKGLGKWNRKTQATMKDRRFKMQLMYIFELEKYKRVYWGCSKKDQ